MPTVCTKNSRGTTAYAADGGAAYIEQQKMLDRIAEKLGVIAIRPYYHRKTPPVNEGISLFAREIQEHRHL